MADAPSSGGGGGGDLAFFIGVMLLFFLVWVAGGGPSRPISFSGPYLQPITGPGVNANAYGDPSSYSSINGTIGKSGYSAAGGSVVGLVKDSTGAKSSDEKGEYVSLYVSPLVTTPVSTAGWKLVSAKSGEGAAFPQGAELPTFGRVNTLTSISLKPGDQAIVVSGRSPVGVSFRENKCTGYLEERQDFKPPMNQNCPTPYQELQRFGDDENERCVEYVRSIPYCAAATNVPSSVNGSCRDFVEEHLNYNGCVAAHKNDSDFYMSTWRIYLGSGDALWKNSQERIELRDASGAVLDSLSY